MDAPHLTEDEMAEIKKDVSIILQARSGFLTAARSI